MKTLVLGLGNPFCSDDGVGHQVVEELRPLVRSPDVALVTTSLGGLHLLDIMLGFDRVIVVDAAHTPGRQPGQVYRLAQAELKEARGFRNAHTLGVGSLLRLGETMGIPLPKTVVAIAVEVSETWAWGAEVSPPVARAVPHTVRLVLEELTCTS